MNRFRSAAVSETSRSSQTPRPTPEIAQSFSIGSAAAGVLRAHTAALRFRGSMGEDSFGKFHPAFDRWPRFEPWRTRLTFRSNLLPFLISLLPQGPPKLFPHPRHDAVRHLQHATAAQRIG